MILLGAKMTSSIISPDESWSMDSNNTNASVRLKRKRRQRDGGAVEDCFACRARGTKCDRKRPYCTQCIEIGRECSGYRTTLTWGIGVASRGKLRGLSCPVANKNTDGSDINSAENVVPSENGSRTSSVGTIKEEDDSSNMSRSDIESEYGARHVSPSEPNNHPTQLYHTGYGQMETVTSGFHDHVQSARSGRGRNASLEHPTLDQPIAQYEEIDMTSSSRSISSYSEQDYYSPMEYSVPSTCLPFYEGMTTTTSNAYPEPSLTTSSMDDFNVNSTSLDTFTYAMSDNIGYLQTDQTYTGSRVSGLDHATIDSFNNALMYGPDPPLSSYAPVGATTASGYGLDSDNERKDTSLADTQFSNPFCHVTPRLQSWMEYYDRNICPYLVAFDGPENPYRKHVLLLAVHNEGLQNAIAALSTNNLRMRRKELRRFGFADEITDAFRGSPSRDLSEPSAEELCYKQMSIDQLNIQLTDKRAAQDDSVLATLLILCLFHVCDSGFSKFKTQLAGVQKLLAFRDPKSQSDFTRWIHMFFTWFDVMTSAVNDREMQTRGDSIGMLDFSTNLGAMEQFSGCDGKLFKLVARLSRLNLLAQGRPVRSLAGVQPMQRTTYVQPTNYHSTRSTRRYSGFDPNNSLAAADYANIDGNGWSTTISSSDEEDIASLQGESNLLLDDRTEFWAEWHDIRSRLQSFQMDLPNIPSATSPNVPSDPAELELSQRDMIHINESFRCSALLYTERLGYPVRPSSHHSFQRLVSEALHHINSLGIDSCVNKFLLWPLFIIGTECVDERHRDIVRKRCIEVQKESGFYNNISTLEVLEKVWFEAGNDVYRTEDEEIRARRRDSESSQLGRYGQAFRWRKAMDRVDGEYIVV